MYIQKEKQTRKTEEEEEKRRKKEKKLHVQNHLGEPLMSGREPKQEVPEPVTNRMQIRTSEGTELMQVDTRLNVLCWHTNRKDKVATPLQSVFYCLLNFM